VAGDVVDVALLGVAHTRMMRAVGRTRVLSISPCSMMLFVGIKDEAVQHNTTLCTKGTMWLPAFASQDDMSMLPSALRMARGCYATAGRESRSTLHPA
jgi:hypothetical protein